MKWKNLYRGFIMGTVDIVPGISSATIAVILGFYDQLIAAINGFFSREWKKHFLFLFPLVIGMGLAIFSVSRLMSWLLENFEQPTFYFFLGLIIGVIPYLFYEAKAKETFKWYHYLFLVVGIILIILLPSPADEGLIITERSISTYMLLFFSGIMASAVMVLPGISGSLMLVIIGVYPTVIHAVSTLDIPVIIVVGIGIAIGVVIMSKVIYFFLRHFRHATFSLIIGLVIGSVYVIFPGLPTSMMQLFTFLVVFVLGFMTAVLLSRFEY